MNIEHLLTSHALMEREDFDATTAHQIERLLSRMAAVERYRIVRKYCFGTVADAACGCGYGSAMIARCPAVDKVIGYDRDPDALSRAQREFGTAARFVRADFDTLVFEPVDTIVSIETIEHLAHPHLFIDAVTASTASRFIATFPSFPTSDFNRYHLNDITLPELTAMVGREPVRAIEIDDAVWMVVYDL